jgi:hypothetical protein
MKLGAELCGRWPAGGDFGVDYFFSSGAYSMFARLA